MTRPLPLRLRDRPLLATMPPGLPGMRVLEVASQRSAGGRRVPTTYRYDAKGDRVEKDVAGGVFERYALSKAEQSSNGIACWHVIAVYGASDSWRQTFVFADAIDAVVMLEQKEILVFDSDANSTELTRSLYHVNALGSVARAHRKARRQECDG